MSNPRVIYLRPEGDELADALAVAAARDLRSINSFCLAILEDYMVKAGFLKK